MDGPDRERQTAGFRVRTRLATARRMLREAVAEANTGSDGEGITGVEWVEVASADGRVLSERVTAERDVPHYDRAAMDGYAVRASDTHGASNRSPAILQIARKTPGGSPTEDDDESDGASRLDPDTAARVHTGSAVPAGADAVVRIEDVTELPAIGEL